MKYGFNQILNNPDIGYAFYNVISGDDGKPVDYEFLEVNETFEKLTGIKNDDLTGRKVGEIITEFKNHTGWKEFYSKIKTSEENSGFEVYFERR